MAEAAQTPTEAAPVAPAATQEAEAPKQPARSFRDVKIRRVSERDAQEPIKVEPPVDSIPRAAQLPAAGAETGNAAGAASEAGTQGEAAGETASSTEDLSPAFRALHKQKQKIRAREEAVAQREKENEAILRDYRELSELSRKDKLAFARRLGLDPAELAKLDQSKPLDPRTSAVEREVQELKAQLAKRDEEALVAKRDALHAELRQDVHKLVTEKRDELKYINAWDSADEVFKTVLTFQDVHGRLPSEADVAKIAKDVDAALKAKHEAANKRLGGTAPATARAATAPSSLSALRSSPEAAAPRPLTRAEKLRDTARVFDSFLTKEQ
jgi:hypothetical protein